MLKCDKCVREFETPKSLSSHKAWHTRKENKRKDRLAGILSTPEPQPVSKIDIDLSPEGHLKVSIKKANRIHEEFEAEL